MPRSADRLVSRGSVPLPWDTDRLSSFVFLHFGKVRQGVGDWRSVTVGAGGFLMTRVLWLGKTPSSFPSSENDKATHRSTDHVPIRQQTDQEMGRKNKFSWHVRFLKHESVRSVVKLGPWLYTNVLVWVLKQKGFGSILLFTLLKSENLRWMEELANVN